MREKGRPDAAALLAELGYTPRLTIYLASVPGAGKTHRLLSDAVRAAEGGRRVAIGWVELKDRPQLAALAAGLPRIPARRFDNGGRVVEDFDVEAALASTYEIIVLDELAHANGRGAPNAKRWQDALALRTAGKSVLGALNVIHIDAVAPVAERVLGYPVREIVPMTFLRNADRVIALDVAPSILESRLRSGRIVRDDDVERAAEGLYRPRTLEMLRELLLRTVDDLTVPVLAPSKVSIALAVVTAGPDAETFVRRAAAFADALDLALETTPLDGASRDVVERATLAAEGGVIPNPPGLAHGDLREVRAALLVVPRGPLADRILERPLDRDLLVADPGRVPVPRDLLAAGSLFGQSLGDRMQIGYGALTIYLGSVAGSGKTYAMLERAHGLVDDGVDVVAGLVETHGRADTERLLQGLETIERAPNGELDLDGILRRRPALALVDELAHTNERGHVRAKRYDDVLTLLRNGIDVITTLNVQHLEGVVDAVERLTGTRVRETLPDAILELAREVVFVDVTPDVMRERLREGKIYPPHRVDVALTNFFRSENLAALRELAVRELLHARSNRRRERPFGRLLLGVAPRARDTVLIERSGRLARRLDVDLRVVCARPPGAALPADVRASFEREADAVRGTFGEHEAHDPAAALVALARSDDVVVIESPRGKRRWFGPASFAVRLLAAGAQELLVLAPRTPAERALPD